MGQNSSTLATAAGRLVWNGEAPVASLIAVPGTPCRATISRRALERLAGGPGRRLGPAACLAVVERQRAALAAIAAAKYRRDGAGADLCIHVTAADIVLADAVRPAAAAPAESSGALAPVAGIAA